LFWVPWWSPIWPGGGSGGGETGFPSVAVCSNLDGSKNLRKLVAFLIRLV
jgi:hypothetical protein